MKMSADRQTQETPFYGPIPKWVSLSGIGRTTTYELISSGALQTRKVGNRTLIDIRAGLAWLDGQPSAQVRMTKKAA